MPRKGEVPKRIIETDPRYTEETPEVRRRVTKFINTVMSEGKKSIAEQIVYGAFDIDSRDNDWRSRGLRPLDDSQTPNGCTSPLSQAFGAVEGAKWAITGKQNWRSGLNREWG
jgi:hypothetical protein